MSHADTAADPVLDAAPGLIRGHRRSGLSGAAKTALADAKAAVDPADISSVRESFRTLFGGATADQALRQIDRRVGGGLDIRGEHVQTAAVAAMEMLSPLIRCGRAVQTAEGGVAAADKAVAAAQIRLDRARSEKGFDDRYAADRGVFSPGSDSDREKSTAELAAAEKAATAAQAELADARERLAEANRNLDTCRKSLEPSFLPGEDEVVLLRQHAGAAEDVVAAAERVEAATQEIRSAQAEFDSRSKDRDEARERGGYFGDALNPGISKPYEAARQALQEAKAGGVEAERAVQEALAELRGIDVQLDALLGGPGLRRAQLLLDNLGDDPRLQQQMAERAPSSYLEKGKAAVKSNLQPKELAKTVGGLVPLVSTFTKYGEMVDLEDQERRLDAATDRLGATPMAASMSQVLARDAEIGKNKAGIAMAIGFVASGVSMTVPGVGGSALGALLGPTLSTISTGVQQGTASALGATASSLLGSAASSATTWTIKKVATTVATTGVETILPEQLEADRRKLVEQLAQASDVAVPEGTAMPVIPKGDGSGEVWPLSNPDVSKALLAYLGPGPDQKMLADPRQHDTEERRLLLREQTFGTPRSVDLTPGKAASALDRQVIAALDKGRGRGGASPPQTSPLQTLYAALGWMKT